MRLYQDYVDKREQKRQALLEKLLERAAVCREANMCLKGFLAGDQYIDYPSFMEMQSRFTPLYEALGRINQYRKLSGDNLVQVQEFYQRFGKLGTYCQGANTEFVKAEKVRWAQLFASIEGRALDEQQQDCIVKEQVNHLVIAGAGSGKTTTIVGKVRYLLERYGYSPGELLILSFTKASATEMAQRLSKETGKDLDVFTFHKLGKEIIAQVEGKQPLVTNIGLDMFVRQQFESLLKVPGFLSLVANYVIGFSKQYKDAFQFKTLGEYQEYLQESSIVTLKGERVKSHEEMVIANFLFSNNIPYQYEGKYIHDVASREFSQYCPDFYLPQYDIYIEHFGIDRTGNVPPFFSARKGMTAKESYWEGIKWKRQTHKQYGTTLVETYSYEMKDGVLTEELKDKLVELGVQFRPMSQDALMDLLGKKSLWDTSNFSSLIATFICHMKANQVEISGLQKYNQTKYSGFPMVRNLYFLKIVAPIYDEYQRALVEAEEIDFNDMINRAAAYIIQGRYKAPYRYIIVDEYQDISVPRYRLIKAIKDQRDCRLFCVGDDWQSIYRFAGSDISLFTGFQEKFGYAEKSYIETTYRFPQSIIELSGNFILKNPGQIRKTLRSPRPSQETAFQLVYGRGRELATELQKLLDNLPPEAEVLLLGRYNSDIDFFLGPELSMLARSGDNTKRITYTRRKDLRMQFMTIHGSKGLQGDYVFILNNTRGTMGFPSEIQDDPVLDLVLQEEERYPFAEERRLYYVAMTRCKTFLYLMVDLTRRSSFVQELERSYAQHREGGQRAANLCPQCQGGKLVKRKGTYGLFWGCSRYPRCTYTLSTKQRAFQRRH